jgi:hypothetical protein
MVDDATNSDELFVHPSELYVAVASTASNRSGLVGAKSFFVAEKLLLAKLEL